MNDSQQEAGANSESSPFDQAEEIFSGLVEQLKDREFKTLLEKCNSEFIAAKPTIEPTDNDLEDIEQARLDDRFQRRCKCVRNLAKAITERMSSSPDSELFRTAKNILGLLDEIEAGDESKWRQLDTTLYVLVQLCRGEGKKPIEKEQNTSTAKFLVLKAFFWKLYEKTLKVIIDSVLEKWWPK